MHTQQLHTVVVDTSVEPPSRSNLHIRQVRAQLLNALLRWSVVLGGLIFLASAWPVAQLGYPALLLIYLLVLAALATAAFNQQLGYSLKAHLLVGSTFLLGLTELLHFGYSEDAYGYLFTGTMFAALFGGRRSASHALAISSSMMLGVGLLLALGWFSPLVAAYRPLSLPVALVTSLTFVALAGTLQYSIVVIFEHLRAAWRSEETQREALEQERAQLEQRVAARTGELSAARDQAERNRAEIARQHQFRETLHALTIDLLNRHQLDDLLSSIVERATEVLDAPHAELMLLEGDELVVRACSVTQPFLKHDRVRRHEALLSWQAVDSLQLITLDDYATWPGRRAIYDPLPLHAVVDIPIVSSSRCLGVLALGRTTPDYPFTTEQCRQGELFAQLVAVVLDNAQLTDLVRREAAERRTAYATLQRTAEALEAQNAELEAFAHTVAHDIKNPLTAIVGFGQLLQLTRGELSPAQIDEYLGRIVASGRKTEAIVDALLLLASVRDDHPVALRPLTMSEVVEGIERRLHSLIQERGAILVLPSSWPPSLGYGPWVEEIWANYVSNAIKYGGPRPRVTLGADSPTEGMVRFWVRDNGPGLSEAEQARLFTAFARLHIDQAPGHGLGLSIVQRIARRLGGQVGVESAPGQGSLFYFTLLAAEREHAV